MKWRREKKREKKGTVSLQPVWAQEPRNFVRETCGPYIYGEELNHYTSKLRSEL